MSDFVMFSAAEESYPYALAELRAVCGPGFRSQRLGPDLGVVLSDVDVVAVADACAAGRVVFIRHLSVERARLPLDRATPEAIADAVVETVAAKTVALQVWSSGEVPSAPKAGEIVAAVTAALDAEVVRAGARQVLSVVSTPAGVSIGLNATVDSLADWPGGRVRLARDARQISRAEFKLEELFTVYDVDLPPDGRALDLGAAPGGWTRVLRERGLDVWAVDPGDLDDRLASDRHVHHVRTTAGEFFRSRPDDFDVVVNDMRMDPRRSCQVMRDAARHLAPGGTAIVTLKTGSQRPVETVRDCLGLLASHYRVEFARQLHHNRHEVTVVGRRLPRRDAQ